MASGMMERLMIDLLDKGRIPQASSALLHSGAGKVHQIRAMSAPVTSGRMRLSYRTGKRPRAYSYD
jgi:hypothetical protein